MNETPLERGIYLVVFFISSSDSTVIAKLVELGGGGWSLAATKCVSRVLTLR